MNFFSSLFLFGFKQNVSDYSLFIKNNGNYMIILLVYVDDVILTDSHESELKKVKDFLKTQLIIKDIGLLKYFLGIEVVNIENGLCLN